MTRLQFFTGFIIAFIHNWELTLIMMAITPIQVACGFATARVRIARRIRQKLEVHDFRS